MPANCTLSALGHHHLLILFHRKAIGLLKVALKIKMFRSTRIIFLPHFAGTRDLFRVFNSVLTGIFSLTLLAIIPASVRRESKRILRQGLALPALRTSLHTLPSVTYFANVKR